MDSVSAKGALHVPSDEAAEGAGSNIPSSSPESPGSSPSDSLSLVVSADAQRVPTSASSCSPLSQLEDELKALVRRMRDLEVGCMVTTDGRVVTYSLSESPAVVIIDGYEAWHYHDNPRFSDCILDVPGLAKMHACAAYLSLRSSYFEAMFCSTMQETSSRVVQLCPPSLETFMPCLYFLYTGTLRPEDAKDLEAEAIKTRPDAFWGLYETAHYLSCSSLLDHCLARLGTALKGLLTNDDVRPRTLYDAVRQASWEAFKPLLDHSCFQPAMVPASSVSSLMKAIPSKSGRLAVLMAWLKGETETPQDISSTVALCARDAATVHVAAIDKLMKAFPATFKLVLHSEYLVNRLLSMGRLAQCMDCNSLVPYWLRDEADACFELEHPGEYSLYRKGDPYDCGGWSCCQEPRKRVPGCKLVRKSHRFGSSDFR